MGICPAFATAGRIIAERAVAPVLCLRLHPSDDTSWIRNDTAENLLLADDTLHLPRVTWEHVIKGCKRWLETYADHPKRGNMQEFADTDFDRFNGKLKEIRNILLAIIGVSRPWEVLVGQAIAELVNANADGNAKPKPNSLRQYLGEKLCRELLRLRTA
jgi:hypothetical protein